MASYFLVCSPLALLCGGPVVTTENPTDTCMDSERLPLPKNSIQTVIQPFGAENLLRLVVTSVEGHW